MAIVPETPEAVFREINGLLDKDNIRLEGLIGNRLEAESVDTDRLNILLPTWLTPTLLNSWENYENEAGTYQQAKYVQTFNKQVHIKGLVKKTTGAASTNIFTLPEGMRPSKQLIFTMWSDTGATRVDITSAGNIVYLGLSSEVEYLSLSGISFYPN